MFKLFIIAVFFSVSAVAQELPADIAGLRISDRVPCTPVKDQYQSSTCWSFASNSFLESELMKKGFRDLDLSEMYIARYSYINKVKQHLATRGKSFFTPGGQFHDVMRVIREHGMVPEQAYNGKPHGELNHDHNQLDTLMKQMIQSMIAKGKAQPSKSDLDSINRILDKFLGKVPAHFIYKGKTYTPKTFASDYLHFNPDDYLEITSYTQHPFYKSYVFEDKYNWSNDYYMNVPLNDFMTITDAALQNGYSVCWDGDVEETGFRYDLNVATLTDNIPDFVTERQRTFEDKSSSLDHMMHIVGSGIDKNEQKWYLVKNSWGINNSAGGYIYMSEAYFKIKTMAIIVDKNAIPAGIRKQLQL